MSRPPTREQLRDHLVATRIAGDVATPRQDNLRNFRLLSERAPLYTFGLDLSRSWTPGEVLATMAERCGVSPDPGHLTGPDTIDPDRTLDRLDAMAEQLRRAAVDRARVVLATGHPTGLLPLHIAVGAALAEAGATVLLAGTGRTTSCEGRHVEIRHVAGVAVIRSGGDLAHTHAPEPMRRMLDALAADGEAPPDLVMADHGYAGAAATAGITTVGFADSNDPALFAGEAEGLVDVAVPLDDNVLPHYYDPLAAYLTRDLRRD